MKDKLKREYYNDINYKPFIIFLVFGISEEEFTVSEKKYKVDEIPECIDIRVLSREKDGEYLNRFFQGEMGNVIKKSNEDLYELCKETEKCAVIQGYVVEDDSLKYMRNVIGIIQAFFDNGAAGVLDLQTFSLFSSEDWKERFFEKEVNAQNHVMIFCSEENGKYWLHTRGMGEFGRPDIGIKDVPEEKLHVYKYVIDQMIYYSGRGLLFLGEKRLHTDDGKIFLIKSDLVKDRENPDYNNAYYNVTISEE